MEQKEIETAARWRWWMMIVMTLLTVLSMVWLVFAFYFRDKIPAVIQAHPYIVSFCYLVIVWVAVIVSKKLKVAQARKVLDDELYHANNYRVYKTSFWITLVFAIIGAVVSQFINFADYVMLQNQSLIVSLCFAIMICVVGLSYSIAWLIYNR